ncbi:hypothetical protein QBC41DRAFT_48303 [Cercophora samala]|uniref:Uncharacterized protein n=1 Tax=Cercophora samala TaxID=330535 RepID=A0AA39YV56_9PEZI|nr:hypothetical protein QBC41DRAFT_48303 [Cercophora samala]
MPLTAGSMPAPPTPPTPPTPSTATLFSASPTMSSTMSPPMSPYSPPLASPCSAFSVRDSLRRTVSTICTPEMKFSQQELAWAKSLMSEHCNNKGRKSKGEFNYKDANAVLASIAEGKVPNATPALVYALQSDFDANASIKRRKSTNLFKVMTGRDQEDIRSDVLERAVKNCSYDIVYSLAMKADQDALDRALPFAITQNDTAKVFILRSRDANAAPLCDQFLHAVDNGPDDMLPLLLNDVLKGACRECRNKGLVRASVLGNFLKVQSLIDANADPTYDDAAALKAAILGHHEDIAVAIASTPSMTSIPLRLDALVGEAFAAGQDRTLAACLQSGAKGPVGDEVLLEAVKQRRSIELIQSLIQHGASVEHKNGAVIHAAIQSRSVQMLQAVLCGRPSKLTMSTTVGTLASVRSIPIIHDMVSALLSVGLEGESINRLLVISLHGDSLEGELLSRSALVQLLVQRGNADVNFNEGQPLVLASTKGWLGILSVLLSSTVTLQSLQAAVTASTGLGDNEIRLEIVKRLLHVAGYNRQLLEQSVFQVACRSLDLSLLELLPHTNRSSEEVLAGFRAAIANPRWQKPSGLSTVRALLHLGVSGSDVRQAFCHAAKSYERDAFELFAAYVDIRTVIDALQAVIQTSKDWLTTDDKYLWLVHDLLHWGGRGREQANHAFLMAIDAFLRNRCSEAMVETMFSVGHADVNFQAGEALKLAVRAADVEVFKMLLGRGATIETIEIAFFEVMVTSMMEETALSFVDILTSEGGSSTVKEFKKTIPQLRAPIRELLAAHPSSVRLIKRLIKLGVNFDVQEPTVLYGSEFGPEDCTALLWSLLPPRPGSHSIEPAVVQTLIEAKVVDVNFVTPVSKATALILAANFGHVEVVNHLIKAGANSRIRDSLNGSALFYASRNGHVDIVKPLLKAPYKPNDGSLHEAARNLYSKVCSILISTKNFDVNFPSLDHQGRTPLHEMAYCCDGTGSQVDMEDTLSALKKGGLQLFKFWQTFGWKNALILALENPQPFAVVKALLDMLWWEDINNDHNVYTQQQPSPKTEGLIICHYSPTMYLKYLHPTNSEKDAQLNRALEQMLRDKGAEDRYWSDKPSDQPMGAIGYPEALAKEIKRLEKVQRDHDDQLRRDKEAQFQKIFLEQARHDQRLEQEGQATISKVQNSNLLHESKLHQDAEITLQQHQALEEKNYIAHRGRVLANQDKAGLLAVDNNGLAQKHEINEHHQQVMDYQKVQFQQMMDYQAFRKTQMMDQQKHYQAQLSDHHKLVTQERFDSHKLAIQQRTDWQKVAAARAIDEQKVAAMQAVDHQKLLTHKTMEKQKLKASEAVDKHKLTHQHKLNKEKREDVKKTDEQQVTLKKSMAKLAVKEDQRKLAFQYNQNQQKLDFQWDAHDEELDYQQHEARINLATQAASKFIGGPAGPAQKKVVKQKGPSGFIENGEA